MYIIVDPCSSARPLDEAGYSKIRWEESSDTTTLENVINPNHRNAIQEKNKKCQKQEKAQRKKDDKSKIDK
jgi:hypothetical protein